MKLWAAITEPNQVSEDAEKKSKYEMEVDAGWPKASFWRRNHWMVRKQVRVIILTVSSCR
jgi:hypothetical protein